MSSNEAILLKNVEKSKKVKGEKKSSKKILLPLIGIVLLEANYFFTPNYLDHETSKTFPSVVGFFGLIYLLLLISSKVNLRTINNKAIEEKLLKNAPFYFVVTLVLTLIDVVTLKTGLFPLPYFPWMDMVINTGINDRVILGESVLASLKLLSLGYIIGVAVGFITGVMAGWSEKFNYWIVPVTKLLGPIPVTTWIPVVLLLAPSSFAGSVFIIALGVWFPVCVTTMSGVASVRKAFFEVAKTLGADEKYLVLHVAIPAALPNVFIGLFQGMGVACTTLIVAEMLGVKAGLGWYITWAIGWAEYSKVFASIILISLTFTAVNIVLNIVKNNVLSWQKGVVK